jgi:hypothetical protein
MDECGVEPPEPPCEHECKELAEEVFDECMETVGDHEECAALARTTLHDCLVEVCGLEPPPDDHCARRCRHRAKEAYEACRKAGGDEETCGAAAHELFEACLVEECGHEPPPTDCRDECVRAAHAQYEECVAAGGDEDVCAEEARAAAAACVAACP